MKIENNIVTQNGSTYGKKENGRRVKAADKRNQSTGIAVVWQACQLAAGYNNSSDLNRELRDNPDRAVILAYMASNDVVSKLATLKEGQFKLKENRDHIEQADILAAFPTDYDSFYSEYNAEKLAKKADSARRRVESKDAKTELQQATAMVAMLETELANALPSGAKSHELESRLIEAKSAETAARDNYRNKVEPVKQSKLIAMLNQAILAGMDTAPTEGLAASLRDLLSDIGGKINFATENEVESTAFEQTATVKPSSKSKAANKKAA